MPVGTSIGSGIGSLDAMEREHKKLLERGPGRINPLLVPLMITNMAAGNDAPAVGYATVYPLTMFLRVLTAQLMILFFYT